MTLNIQGIDAFTTSREWNAIWRATVAPAQNAWRLNQAQIAFRQRHGRFPNLDDEFQKLKLGLGRRPKPPFTRAETYLPLWKRMKEKPSLSVDAGLQELAGEGKDFDRRNAQRGVKRLDELMQPLE